MKRMNEHTIDRISRELLSNYSEEAPEGAFFAIRDELNVHSKEKRKRFFMYIAASWVVLLSFGMGYLTRSFNSVSDSEFKANKTELDQLKIDNTVAQKKLSILAYLNANKDIKSNSKQSKITHQNIRLKQGNTLNEKNTIEESNSTQLSQLTAITNSFSKTSDSTEKVLSHIDSLKLIYKFIALSSGLSKDSASNESIPLVYENPIFPQESPTRHNWTIVGGVTPMMGFDMIGATPQQEQTVSQLKSGVESPTVEQPSTTNKNATVSFSTGISVKRNVSEKWNMRTGMSYNKISESNSDISYIEVPLMCEYRLLNQKVRIYFTNGLGAGFKQTDLYPLGLSGFSFLYPLNKTIDFNLEPSYKHVFGKTWTYKANYYGMMAGFSIKF